MKNEFIPYEQALELKELGFDELCMAGYDKDFIGKLYIGFSTDDGALFNTEYYILAPLYQQAFRWFRENHNLHHEIEYNGYEYVGYVSGMTANIFKTYEEAELACLKKLIEIAKNN